MVLDLPDTQDTHFLTIMDQINIKDSRLEVKISIYLFKDEEFIVAFSPSLSITGYGLDPEDAIESFGICLEEFFAVFKSKTELDVELNKLGWFDENHHFVMKIDQSSHSVHSGFMRENQINRTMKLEYV